MFYHGVSIVVSNEQLQENVYPNELCYAFHSGGVYASNFKHPSFVKITLSDLSLS